MIRLVKCFSAALCILSGFAAEWTAGPNYRFLDVTPSSQTNSGFTRVHGNESGIQFTNFLSDETVARNRVTENGSGVALGDIDGDGLCDIYFCGLEGDNVLYKNLGNWKFQ